MKRILAIITTLTISWTAFFIAGSEAFASGQLVETKPTLSNLPPSQQSSYKLYKDIFDDLVDSIDASTRQLQQIYTLHRLYYFSLMLDNSLNCSSSISSGNHFNDDYLWFYFDYLLSHYNWSDDGSVGFFTVVNEDGIITNVDEVKFNTEKLGFFPSNWNGRNVVWNLSDPPSYFIKFKSYYNYLYSSYLSEKSPSYIDSTNFAPTIISSSDYLTAINNNTNSLATSVPTTLVSWKHNPLAVSAHDKIRSVNHLAIMVAGKWFNESKDIYAMPYVVDKDGVTYYGDSVYHMHYGDFEFKYNPSSATGVVSTVTAKNYPVIDKYSSLSISSEISDTFYPISPTYSIYEHSWDDAYIVPNEIDNGLESYLVGNKVFYISGLKDTSSVYTLYNYRLDPDTNYISGYSALFNNVYSASNSANNSLFSTFHNFFRGMTVSDSEYSVETADGEKSLNVDSVPYDYGFLICNKRFEIGALTEYLKPDQIPSNSYITISGDSVYDYSITNGDTGDTSNFGDFINNGYAWLNTGSGNQTNNGGGTGGGSGGGNVNVSGSIDVGGSVDININVSGSGGTGTSYDLNTDPINKYLDGALEESGGVRQFLKTFFDFLPAEILGLLGLLISVVIICRILKR